jgi:signal recognition particle subunit SEC65
MQILFDQGTPVALRASLPNHVVRTAREQGWSTLKNGELLKAAEEAGFDVLLTTDKSMPHEQPLQGRKLAVVILNKNKWSLIRLRLNEIAQTVASARPGTYSIVHIPSTETSL